MKQESVIQKGIEAAKRISANGIEPIGKEEAMRKARELVERCEVAMVGSHGTDGYPNIKAMFKEGAQGLKIVCFSTGGSSRRVAQFRSNPKSCVYFFDSTVYEGVMLTGDIEIVDDLEAKRRLWRDGWEAYYPQGVTDPEYCMLRFTARWGNYYHDLQNVSFDMD